MGQAKQRGTIEERIAASQMADQILQRAYPIKSYREAKLREYNGDKIRFAMAVVEQMKENQKQEELTKADKS